MNKVFEISPVTFAIIGLFFFLTGLFIKKNKRRLIICGVAFIIIFLYKLFVLKNAAEAEPGYTYNHNQNFKITASQLYFTVIGLNIAGLLLWLSAMLKAAFERSLPKQYQSSILLSGALIMIASLIIYKIFGGLIGIICFPLLTISFYIKFRVQYKKPSTIKSIPV